MKTYWPIKTWTTKRTWVDIDTGEEITKQIAKLHYTIIQTTKHVTFNWNKTKGTRHITIECRHRQQTELPFTNERTNP